MIRCALLCALATSLAIALFAQTDAAAQTAMGPPDPMPVATRYLDAYARFDLAALHEFWDDASVFQDPTTAEIGAPLGPVRGAKAITKALRGSTQGVTNLSFRFEETFHSGGRVVAIGRLLYTMPAKMLSKTEGDLEFDLRVVTVLHIEGDRVREHTDYSDFSGWRAKIAAATH